MECDIKDTNTVNKESQNGKGRKNYIQIGDNQLISDHEVRFKESDINESLDIMDPKRRRTNEP